MSAETAGLGLPKPVYDLPERSYVYVITDAFATFANFCRARQYRRTRHAPYWGHMGSENSFPLLVMVTSARQLQTLNPDFVAIVKTCGYAERDDLDAILSTLSTNPPDLIVVEQVCIPGTCTSVYKR